MARKRRSDTALSAIDAEIDDHEKALSVLRSLRLRVTTTAVDANKLPPPARAKAKKPEQQVPAGMNPALDGEKMIAG